MSTSHATTRYPGHPRFADVLRPIQWRTHGPGAAGALSRPLRLRLERAAERTLLDREAARIRRRQPRADLATVSAAAAPALTNPALARGAQGAARAGRGRRHRWVAHA